ALVFTASIAVCVFVLNSTAQMTGEASAAVIGIVERNRFYQEQLPNLTAVERIAWREIQERIDRMSHAEEAKDVPASMHFMSADYQLYTLPDKASPKGKVITLPEIAIYKKKNLDSLYSTSQETRTDIESLHVKRDLATIIIHQ